MKISLESFKNKKTIYVIIFAVFVIIFLSVLMLSRIKPEPKIVEKPLPKEPTVEDVIDLYNAPADSENRVEVPKEVMDSYSSPSSTNDNSDGSNSDDKTTKVEIPKEILDSFSAPK